MPVTLPPFGQFHLPNTTYTQPVVAAWAGELDARMVPAAATKALTSATRDRAQLPFARPSTGSLGTLLASFVAVRCSVFTRIRKGPLHYNGKVAAPSSRNMASTIRKLGNMRRMSLTRAENHIL